MHNLKVLLTTYSTAFITSGGGESELVQVSDILNKSGVQSDIYGIDSKPLSFYHAVMHFSLHGNGEAILQEAKNQKKKIFLWPNVWWREDPSPQEIRRIEKIVQMADCLIFKSQTELSNFMQYKKIDKDICRVVRPGVSDRLLLPVDSDLFLTMCDLSDYVICLGLIEPVKNQLSLIRALNKLKINGLMVGGFRDEDYYHKCLKEAHGGIKFLPFLQPCSLLLRSAIANSLIVAEPSFDPPGRSSLEGALLKKPLVIADGAWQREHFKDGAWYASADSERSIAEAIERALFDPNREAKVLSTYNQIYKRHSSEVASRALIECLIENI